MEGKMTQDELASVSQVATAVADEWLNTTEWPENPHDTCLGASPAQRGKKGNINPLASVSQWPGTVPCALKFLSLASLCVRSSRIGSRDPYPRSEGRYYGLPL